MNDFFCMNVAGNVYRLRKFRIFGCTAKLSFEKCFRFIRPEVLYIFLHKIINIALALRFCVSCQKVKCGYLIYFRQVIFTLYICKGCSHGGLLVIICSSGFMD